ncbi:MAG TPA: ChaB family protein [Myxococcaceae bacterium]|nr:ChaB family protein [Myxococcaceae bacterium]
MPGRAKLPSTLRRSPPKAQRTYEKTLEHAEQEYGDGERAHRTALAVLKRGFEKIRDHWAPKKRKGASDPRSAQRSTEARRQGKGETYGGVDAFGNSKQTLMKRARTLGIPGRSRMDKAQLARAIAKKQ